MLALTDNTVKKLISLLSPGDGDQMWRDHYACLLEGLARQDDLSILRTAKEADKFEPGLQAFAAGFPGIKLTQVPEGEFYRAAVGFVKMNRDVRNACLVAYASELRKSEMFAKTPLT